MDALNASISVDVWVPFGAALLGGLCSLAGSLVAIRLSNEHQKEKEIADEKKNGAAAAYGAFHKLSYALNTVENLDRQISEFFKAAALDGKSDYEPWAKVTEIVGSDHQELEITAEETAFLIEAGRAELLNDVHVIQHRVWNISASARKYNEIRSELLKFLEESHDDEGEVSGTTVSATFSGKERFIATSRESRIQNLLGQIMHNIEIDKVEIWRVLQQFKIAAENHFGDYFPKFKFEKVE